MNTEHCGEISGMDLVEMGKYYAGNVFGKRIFHFPMAKKFTGFPIFSQHFQNFYNFQTKTTVTLKVVSDHRH